LDRSHAPTVANENQSLFTATASPAASVIACDIPITMSSTSTATSTVFLAVLGCTALYNVAIAASQINDGVLSSCNASLLMCFYLM